MKNPEVSVVFPTYKRPDDVRETLFILAETLSIPYEVLIIDNSPEPYEYSLRSNERYFFSGANLGTYARNTGIANAAAPYILMLDDDSHPLPGAVEKALDFMRAVPEDIAGVTGIITRLDGARENPPLLPTAFHGCGFLCRTALMRKIPSFYPVDFCFYGEEYLSTLFIYRENCRFHFLEDFKVCHRMSPNGRSVGRILYYITLNNRRTWVNMIPPKYLERVSYDTLRRYELISIKESVHEDYLRAVNEDLVPGYYGKRLSEKQFEDFSLISAFREAIGSGRIDTGRRLCLCGCGKFPTLWAAVLKEAGADNIIFSDFNSGLCGNDYADYTVQDSEAVRRLSAENNIQFICGHSSRTDTARWLELLRRAGIAENSSSYVFLKL